MKLFSKLFPRSREDVSFSISASSTVVEYTDRQSELLERGYRQNCQHEIFEPDNGHIPHLS